MSSSEDINYSTAVVDSIQDRIRKRRCFIEKYGRSRIVLKDIDHQPPEWFDSEKFQYAQQLFKTFKTTFFFTYVYGLTLVVHHRDELIPLLLNGRSSRISQLYQRYFATMKQIISWNECDPFDRNGLAWKSFLNIRSQHIKVEERLQSKLKCSKDNEKIVWFNQQRMCNAQFSFIGLMTIFPQHLGFQTLTTKDFNALFHFWRTIGYCLGIEDSFNLCNGTDEEIFELCRQIYYEEWLPILNYSLENKTISTRLSEGMIKAVNQLDKHINYNVLMKYAHYFLGTPDFPLKTWHEKYCYFLTILVYKFGAKFKLFHWLMAQYMDYCLKQATILKKQYIELLDKKFPENLFSEKEIFDWISKCDENILIVT